MQSLNDNQTLDIKNQSESSHSKSPDSPSEDYLFDDYLLWDNFQVSHSSDQHTQAITEAIYSTRGGSINSNSTTGNDSNTTNAQSSPLMFLDYPMIFSPFDTNVTFQADETSSHSLQMNPSSHQKDNSATNPVYLANWNGNLGLYTPILPPHRQSPSKSPNGNSPLSTASNIISLPSPLLLQSPTLSYLSSPNQQIPHSNLAQNSSGRSNTTNEDKNYVYGHIHNIQSPNSPVNSPNIRENIQNKRSYRYMSTESVGSSPSDNSPSVFDYSAHAETKLIWTREDIQAIINSHCNPIGKVIKLNRFKY